MFDTLHSRHIPSDQKQTTAIQEPMKAKPSLQRALDPTRLPLSIQMWGTQVPPGLRLSVPAPTPHKGEPMQEQVKPLQRQANTTGLPDALKAGVENLSGLSLDDVQVHQNSSKPAELHALAYTQGTQIHVGPGQERHLAHEAWHVVQQKQGRVQPTLQAKDLAITLDQELEHEADVMGATATHVGSERPLRKEVSHADEGQGQRKVRTRAATSPTTTPVVQCVSAGEFGDALKKFVTPFKDAKKAFQILGEQYLEQTGTSLSEASLREFTEWLGAIYPKKVTTKEKPSVKTPPVSTSPIVPPVPLVTPSSQPGGTGKKKVKKTTLPANVLFGASSALHPVVIEADPTNPLILAWIGAQPPGATSSLDTLQSGSGGTGFKITDDTVYIYAIVTVPSSGPPGSATFYKIEIHYHPVPMSPNYLHVKKTAGSSPLNVIDADSWLIPGGKQALKDAVSRYNNTMYALHNGLSTHSW